MRAVGGFRVGRALLTAALLLVTNGARAGPGIDWLTFAGNMQRTGYNAAESVLSPAAVPGLRLRWATDLAGPILTQPTLVRDVETASGRQDLVFAATLYGTVFALDAATGAVVWQVQLGVVQTRCRQFSASDEQVGVIATPTIDPAHRRLLIVDGLGQLHALDIGSGAEAAGYPIGIIDPANQPPLTLVYGSPTLSGQVLYVATSSSCDMPSAHGEIVEIELRALRVERRWFATPRQSQGGGGIWGPGGVSLETDGSALYAATGNAFYRPQNSGYAEHVVQLAPDLRVLAADAPALNGRNDRDFGATPLLFQPPGCPPLLAAMNKSGQLFLYQRAQIGDGPVQQLQIAQSTDAGDFIGIPAYDPATNALYLGSPSDQPPYHHGLLALAVGDDCQLSLLWNRRLGLNTTQFNPMIPPTVADGVVWYADGAASVLEAFDAADGRLLWRSGDRIAGGIFAAPTVVNGRVFVAAFDHKLYAFGL
jgi:outer membrane protein assembly factor BamB